MATAKRPRIKKAKKPKMYRIEWQRKTEVVMHKEEEIEIEFPKMISKKSWPLERAEELLDFAQEYCKSAKHEMVLVSTKKGPGRPRVRKS